MWFSVSLINTYNCSPREHGYHLQYTSVFWLLKPWLHAKLRGCTIYSHLTSRSGICGRSTRRLNFSTAWGILRYTSTLPTFVFLFLPTVFSRVLACEQNGSSEYPILVGEVLIKVSQLGHNMPTIWRYYLPMHAHAHVHSFMVHNPILVYGSSVHSETQDEWMYCVPRMWLLNLCVCLLPLVFHPRSEIYRKSLLKVSDVRISLIGEIVDGIKTVKLTTLGPNLQDRVNLLRSQELLSIRQALTLNACNQVCLDSPI